MACKGKREIVIYRDVEHIFIKCSCLSFRTDLEIFLVLLKLVEDVCIEAEEFHTHISRDAG